MAHYAILNENNIVTSVFVGVDEDDTSITNAEEMYSDMFKTKVLRTSYNTLGKSHTKGGKPFRGNYAQVGFTYHDDLDVFLPPKLFDSWILDEETLDWIPPVPQPDDDKLYEWDEETLQWLEILPEE